jgi:hypothetical protein
MPSFLVLGIWFLLLLSDNGQEEEWFWSLHSSFDEDDDDDGDDGNNFLRMTTSRIRFPTSDIKVRMMLLSWNKYLWSLLHFVVVRSDHNEGLVRINLPLKLILIGFELGRLRSVFLHLRWYKEEEGKHKKEEDDQFHLQECWSPLFGHMFSVCLLRVCLCGHSYES